MGRFEKQHSIEIFKRLCVLRNRQQIKRLSRSNKHLVLEFGNETPCLHRQQREKEPIF